MIYYELILHFNNFLIFLLVSGAAYASRLMLRLKEKGLSTQLCLFKHFHRLIEPITLNKKYHEAPEKRTLKKRNYPYLTEEKLVDDSKKEVYYCDF